jgi:drug/metabolite transporter (DMT)-like permease
VSDADTRATATGALTVTLTLVGWSAVPLFLRHFADHIDAWTSNGWRYGFSALLWAPLLILAALRGTLPRGLWRAALVPSLVNAMGQVTFCWAHYKIDPGLLSFGLRSQMIFTALGAYILFANERPVIRSPLYLVAVVAVLGGTSGTLLLGDQPLTGAHAAGVGLSLLTGLFFALYGITVRQYMSEMGSVVAFAAISQYTAAAMVVLMLLRGEGAGIGALELPRGEFVLLLVSAVIGIALGHVFYYMSIRRLGVAISSGVLQTHPFAVGIGSLLLFGEKLTSAQWTSGVIAVGGALLMLAARRRMAPTRAPAPSTLALAKAGSD